MTRRAPGEVRDAINRTLREAGVDGATVAAIQAGVEERIGAVPSSSVRSYLRLNEGKTYERLGHGAYRLRNVR